MKDYFFGRYFKCCSKDGAVAFIPAFHSTGGVTTASVQLITDDGAWNIPFDITEYRELGDSFGVAVGENAFRRGGMTLDLRGDCVNAKGEIGFGAFTPLGGDIMGPFRFVPFLECRHSVYSARHALSGSLEINGKVFDMTDGAGYIEGDRGSSFPRVYAWTQALFPGGSLMLSVAEIPYGPMRFTGVIGFVLIDGREYRIATYRGAKALRIEDGRIEIKQGKLTFCAALLEKRAYPLRAPTSGAMVRTIRESASCRAAYTLIYDGKTVLDLDLPDASFEYEYPDQALPQAR